MKISGFIISSLIICFPILSHGQNQQVLDVENQNTDSTTFEWKKIAPSGFRLGVDLISFGQEIYHNQINKNDNNEFSQWKLSMDIDISRYLLNVELGANKRKWNTKNDYYYNQGWFYKTGVDINFLKNDIENNALFVGGRFASAFYDDKIVYEYINDSWGNLSIEQENKNNSAKWFEVTTGLKVKLSKILWMGYTSRFQFGLQKNTNSSPLKPYWIPGYGRSEKITNWGFEYFFILRIPFKK